MERIRSLRNPFLENWFQVNTAGYFIIICLLYFTSFIIKRMFIFDNIAAFEVLQDRGEMWLFDLFFALQYLTVPIFLGWKITLTAFLLWTGCFLFGYRITYAQLWKMVLIFELIFIVPEFLKVFWFMGITTDPTYQDFISFYPLCLINLVDADSISPSLAYPLKALSLFELTYWVALILGIFWISGKRLRISAYIVGVSYIALFLLWIVYYVIVYR